MEMVASIKVCTPKRVTLAELDRLRAEDAAARAAASTTLESATATAAVALPTLECSAPKIPQGPCPVCPRLAAEFEPWRQAAFYQSMHQKALERERLLKLQNQQ